MKQNYYIRQSFPKIGNVLFLTVPKLTLLLGHNVPPSQFHFLVKNYG